MSNQSPVGDFSDAEKERQNSEYVEWFESKNEFDEDAPLLKPISNFNLDSPVKESKAGNFFIEIFGSLVAAGLLSLFFFL